MRLGTPVREKPAGSHRPLAEARHSPFRIPSAGHPNGWTRTPHRNSLCLVAVKTSIIIPALNEAAHIAVAVTRALATDPLEVLVIDGGSHDATPEFARQAGGTVFESPSGRAAQMNVGAKRARGDVLLFLHADSWLPADALNQIETAMDDSWVGGGAFRQRIEADGRAYRLLEFGNALRAGWLKIPYGDQGIFLRRDLFEELGGYPDVRFMEDVLLMRSLRRRTRIVLLPGPIHTSARRWQKHGILRQTVRNWLLLAAEKLGVPPDRLADLYRPHQDAAASTSRSTSARSQP